MTRSRCLAAARQAPWLAALVVAAGCTRSFFRERADRDVEALLEEKGADPRWAVESWHIYPDPRARFADTDKPDHPKKPPDVGAPRVASGLPSLSAADWARIARLYWSQCRRNSR